MLDSCSHLVTCTWCVIQKKKKLRRGTTSKKHIVEETYFFVSKKLIQRWLTQVQSEEIIDHKSVKKEIYFLLKKVNNVDRSFEL